MLSLRVQILAKPNFSKCTCFCIVKFISNKCLTFSYSACNYVSQINVLECIIAQRHILCVRSYIPQLNTLPCLFFACTLSQMGSSNFYFLSVPFLAIPKPLDAISENAFPLPRGWRTFCWRLMTKNKDITFTFWNSN